ncbi:MAG: PD40 domain-containing protein [Chloroflexi bacterium]|nr:PD40 domain-containing protein [Chloroflexota bacterium]
MNVDGTGNQKLADGISASWSPDGRLVAYWTEDRGGSSTVGDIVIIDVDTRVSVWLGEFTSDESPAWSPDPRRNVFHNMAVYAANAKDATATPLFDRPAEIVGWSSGGTKVAYVDGSAFGRGPRSLVLLDTVSGRQETVHTSNADTAHALGSGYRGVWSPDGRYYAYSAIESADEKGLVVFYVTDTESGTTNRLWEGTVLDSISAVYSPDGSKLLLEIDVDRSPSVWLANADGAALSEVADGQMLRPPWRPGAD